MWQSVQDLRSDGFNNSVSWVNRSFEDGNCMNHLGTLNALAIYDIAKQDGPINNLVSSTNASLRALISQHLVTGTS